MFSHYFFQTSLLTALALIAFAANSVLCRLALASGAIDASSFTIIRMLSGAMALVIIFAIKRCFQPSNLGEIKNGLAGKVHRKKNTITVTVKALFTKGGWLASVALFSYAITFSYAYISVGTGAGALILFGSVQITMVLLSIRSGVRLHSMEWLGLIIAFLGFIYLLLPSISTPSLKGSILMTIAGISWAIYTVKGANSTDPLMDTTANFLRTTPVVIVLLLFTLPTLNYSTEGVLLALLSGAVTSGVGYTIWYIALRRISSIQAAVWQLSVPVIAAIGGAYFVAEAITSRMMISAAIILGGIFIVTLAKKQFTHSARN